MKTIGVVVPSLFERPDYLRESLESIRKSGNVHVLLMGPDVERQSKPYVDLYDSLFEEPLTGTLSQKLNQALSLLPDEIELMTWLGDDDLLEENSLELCQKIFQETPNLSLIFGICRYIDQHGQVIGKNRSGNWAIPLARWGPFLAPQPGSVFTRRAFESVSRLDSSFELAFDFDLFLSLADVGTVRYVNQTMGSFRWHSESLSVKNRAKSVREASRVRKKHANGFGKLVILLLNPLVEVATLAAGLVLEVQRKR